jgi:hypothetical protein
MGATSKTRSMQQVHTMYGSLHHTTTLSISTIADRDCDQFDSFEDD